MTLDTAQILDGFQILCRFGNQVVELLQMFFTQCAATFGLKTKQLHIVEKIIHHVLNFPHGRSHRLYPLGGKLLMVACVTALTQLIAIQTHADEQQYWNQFIALIGFCHFLNPMQNIN